MRSIIDVPSEAGKPRVRSTIDVPSEAGKPRVRSTIESITKEIIVEEIGKHKCPMLKDLPVDAMSKEVIINHLETACCPVLKELYRKNE